jgi:hypothetical protein
MIAVLLPERTTFREKIMRSIVKESNRAAWIILLVIYGLSFVLPALDHDMYGWQAFLAGMFYCWFLPWTIAWWANVFFWFGLMALSMHAYRKSAVLGLIAFLLGLSFLFYGGEHLHPGYFLWIGSMAGLMLAGAGKAGQAEVEKSHFTALVQNRSLGLESNTLYEPCEGIAPGPPPNYQDNFAIVPGPK